MRNSTLYFWEQGLSRAYPVAQFSLRVRLGSGVCIWWQSAPLKGVCLGTEFAADDRCRDCREGPLVYGDSWVGGILGFFERDGGAEVCAEFFTLFELFLLTQDFARFGYIRHLHLPFYDCAGLFPAGGNGFLEGCNEPKNHLPPLQCLDMPGCKAPPRTHIHDFERNWDADVAGEHKVRVDTVEPKVLCDGRCGSDDRLPDDLAPEDPLPPGVRVGVGEGRRRDGGDLEVALDEREGGGVDASLVLDARSLGAAEHAGW